LTLRWLQLRRQPRTFLGLEIYYYSRNFVVMGTGIHQKADERHDNPTQDTQELLVVRDKVGRPPDELGVSKFVKCDIFLFSALTLLVWRQEGYLVCKKLDVGLLVMI